jgi:class 3 adenylate cyclase/CHASE2 domain-containing sensor protein
MPAQERAPDSRTPSALDDHSTTQADDALLPGHEGAAPLPRPRRRQQLDLWLAAAVVVFSTLLGWWLSAQSVFESLELKSYDLRFVLNGSQAPPSDILLVMIDPRTEAAIPEPRIFWHPHYASLLRAAAQGGARSIGLDVSFALSVEPWAPDFDRDLAAAFAEVSASVPVVLAYDSLQSMPDHLPLYMLAAAQSATGFANFTFDRDGFVRRQELITREGAESFAARLAAVSLSAAWSGRDSSKDGLQLGSRDIPLDASGFLPIHFWGPARTFPMVSMADVLGAARSADAASLKRWFAGKIVLVGSLDPSDQQPTPFYLAGGAQRLTPGVEIHASTLTTLLQGRFLREVSAAWILALMLAGAAIAALCAFRVRFPLGLFLLLSAVGGYLAMVVFSQRSGLVLPVVPPVLAALISGLLSYGAYSLTEGRQRRLLQDVFGRYVSPDVARELLEYGEIPLGGTHQRVTVMFSDLRGYTQYCQGREAQQVVEELNEYFSEMVAEIKAHGGMINKFIGDGIMALFGAPVAHADDACRAVACALRMVERNREFNRRRAARGLPELAIGVALHTGDAVIGHIGAPQKMEYTAIGDTVNVASRIEGENKTFGTRLLISEATYREVRGRFAAELIGHAVLKGVSKPVPVYKVSGARQEGA